MSGQLHLASDADLEALSSVAFTLEPQSPADRRHLLRDEAGFLLDGLLVRVARGHGALDLALGSGLASLLVGDRLLRLGFSSLGDYARERLGLSGSTAGKLARLARSLADRPLLRAAVRSGAVTPRKAETIAALARGSDEAAWVAKARVETVRALAAEVREALGDGLEDEETWERVAFAGTVRDPNPVALAPAIRGPSAVEARTPRQSFDEALAVAGTLLGAGAPRWQRLEAICQEFIGAHPAQAFGEGFDDSPMFDRGRSGGVQEELKAWLEQEYRRWDFLTCRDPAPVAEVGGEAGAGGDAAAGAAAGGGAACGEPELARLDAELRGLRDLRARWDELLGHLAMLLRQAGLWRDMMFFSFAHYCEERLGMSPRSVEQRIALERRLYWLPDLRDAMRSGRVSYEKARVVAAHATEATLEAWLDRADRLTCVALTREAAERTEAQLCAEGAWDFRLPARVAILLHDALRAAQQVAGRWITAEQALGMVSEHYLLTWEVAARQKNTVQRRVLDRDRGWCQVPGCSRAAQQVHHVQFRSHLGATVEENLVSLCAAHHLHGIHAGYLRVTGRAPDRLRWGVRPGGGAWVDFLPQGNPGVR
jgi:hypothetical protein